MNNQEKDYICGIEREIVESFLILFRDNYKKADEASYFLELKEGVSNASGIANIRDALSHFVSALDTRITLDERRKHLTNTEEHLRRAITEPYKKAVNGRLAKFRSLYTQYKKEIEPNRGRYDNLSDAPTAATIETLLVHIEELIKKGRESKTKNTLNEEWEETVNGFVDAYNLLCDLYNKIERYKERYQQHRNNRLQLVIAIWALVATLISTVLGIMTLMR